MYARKSKGVALQRLFSTFPGNSPGVGLLLLRSMLGFTAIIEGGLFLSYGGVQRAGAWVAAGLLIVSGVSLLVGFFTLAVSILIGLGNLGIMLSWLSPPRTVLDYKFATALLIVISVAIALLGPGAFSLDARRFGRREINIPKAPPPTKR